MTQTPTLPPVSPDLAAVIDGYAPDGVDPVAWSAVSAEVRRWVTAAGPQHRRRALQLLYACAHLAVWCRTHGVPVAASTALRDTAVEQFCSWAEAHQPFSPTTRSTIRARLRHVARANDVTGNRPAPPALGRGQIRPPYSTAEIESFLLLAGSQRDPDRRRRLTGLITAAVGAGCSPEDFRHLRGSDIRPDQGALWVHLQGRRPRSVPVIDRYADALREAAEATGDRYLIGGLKPERRSVTTSVLHRIDGGLDLPPIEPGRLRATWLAHHLAAGVRIDVLMDAAGLATPTTIVELAPHLPAPPVDAWRHLVTGSRA